MIGLSSLIVTNVRRNLARSLLTVVGMGVAALIMTTSLTLSEGYPAAAYEAYRNYCGGDILLFRDKVWVRGADINRSTPGSWEWARLDADLPGPAGLFLPGLATSGFVGPAGEPRGFFSAADVDEIGTALAGIAGISAVRPYFALPVARTEWSAGDTKSAWDDAYLRAWPADASAAALSSYVVAGRALRAEDEGARVCLVDATRAKLGELEGLGLPGAVPPVGSVIRVFVPQLGLDAQGRPSVDHLAGQWVELTVVGHYAVPSREATWMESSPGDAGGAQPRSEQLYLASPELFVPARTADALLAVASQGQADLWAQAMVIEVDSLARVETVTAAVASALPGLCPVSVPALARLANAQYLPEPVYRVPATEWATAEPPAQVGEPVRISAAFSVIFFAVAALLAAANGIVLVIERQREIAILKAVGAYARDVILMILGEVVLLASIGSFVGFAAAESLAVWNLVSNGAAWGAVLVSVGVDLIKVMGTTVAFAALFGLAPALRTTQMTAMEVLRRE